MTKASWQEQTLQKYYPDYLSKKNFKLILKRFSSWHKRALKEERFSDALRRFVWKLPVGKYFFVDAPIAPKCSQKTRINTLNVYKVRFPMMAYLVKPGVVHQISLVSIVSYD